MFDRINGFLLQKGQDDLLANKPILKLLKQFILCSREENVSQEMEVMSCFLLLPENKVFLGFWYFAKLMNECTDGIIVRNRDRIERIVNAYTQLLDPEDKSIEEQ